MAESDKIDFDSTERQALFASHFTPMWELESELELLKRKKREMRALAKLEGFEGFEFDFAIKIRKTRNSAVIQDQIRRQIAVARYLAMPIGRQFEFFETDLRPDVDRAFDAGRDSGLWGDSLRNPYDQSLPQWEAYNQGYATGQAERREALQKQMEERNARDAMRAANVAAELAEKGEAVAIDAKGPARFAGLIYSATESEAEPEEEEAGRTLAGRVVAKRGRRRKIAA